ncbi:MAG: hypothetical protein CMF96_09585 [Candidatus Marinimicrobia bacterium]|nr:hypothetical protein [Candidatus Neomarinimicrobiota bacterium]|tara:strand:- start:3542 stop:4654 length:1113 start_codon:yes stop_codon:yes gene_type:complete
MELNQNNKSITLSLSQVKNNNGKSNMWEVAKQSQIKSANRLHFDGKNNRSKDIIENFTKGLERENIQNKSVDKSTISKNIEIQNLSQKLNVSPKKNNNILQQNLNQKVVPNFQKGLAAAQEAGLKNLKAGNLMNTQSSKFEKATNPKVENSLINNENNQKKKLNNKDFTIYSKKKSKIIEMGHTQIVHEIDKDSNRKNDNKKAKELIVAKELEKKPDISSKFEDKIENSKININYTEDNQLEADNENPNEDFKESLFHLLNHFNTKIKGEIQGNHFGEFQIKTEEGDFSVSIKKEGNHITININSDLIHQIEGQIENIENAIIEKMPEIDSITINTTHLTVDYHLENFSNSSKEKINLNQNSIFKLNFLA